MKLYKIKIDVILNYYFFCLISDLFFLHFIIR